MIVAQRRKMIKDLLIKKKSIKNTDLVDLFDVSEETIRRDLIFLEKEGFLKKSYGGAILNEEYSQDIENIPPVEQRKSRYYEEKIAIGKAAKKLVKDNQIIILDAGTTTWCVAKHLKEFQDMTFVTNGLNVAEECSKSDNSNIFLIGGKLIKKSMSLVGPQAMNELKKYNANFVFLGATGISPEKGFLSSDIYEAEVKRSMVSSGRKVVIVADHSKFEKHGLVSFSDFEHVDIVITSDLVDMEVCRRIEEMGVEVIRAELNSEEANNVDMDTRDSAG